jgi:hypothetical protein
MSATSGVSNGDRREQLEERANAVRARLADRLDALEERGERVRALAHTLTRPPASVFLLGAVGVALTAVVVYRVRHRPSAFERLIEQLRPIPEPPPEGRFVGVLKRGALSLLTLGVRRLARRGLAQLMAATSEHDDEPRRAVAPAPMNAPPRP